MPAEVTGRTLGHVIFADPKRAAEIILEMFRQEKCNKGRTVARLKVAHGTFLRWVAHLKLESKIGRMIIEATNGGWIDKGKKSGPKKRTTKRRAKRT